jgi:hypothetical protein
MYVGSCRSCANPAAACYDTLLETVEHRLPQVPRYRQKVREVTMGLARPVWIDDRDFDITYHIRRSALPSPGSDASCTSWWPGWARGPGQVPAAVGDVPGRGPVEEPRGHLHQVAPGAGQRDDGGRARPRHRRPDPAPAGVRRGHLDPGRTRRGVPARWCRRRLDGRPRQQLAAVDRPLRVC